MILQLPRIILLDGDHEAGLADTRLCRGKEEPVARQCPGECARCRGNDTAGRRHGQQETVSRQGFGLASRCAVHIDDVLSIAKLLPSHLADCTIYLVNLLATARHVVLGMMIT